MGIFWLSLAYAKKESCKELQGKCLSESKCTKVIKRGTCPGKKVCCKLSKEKGNGKGNKGAKEKRKCRKRNKCTKADGECVKAGTCTREVIEGKCKGASCDCCKSDCEEK